MLLTQKRVLVLNKSWLPVRVTTVRKAVQLLYQDTARVVDPDSFHTYCFDTWREAADFSKREWSWLRASGWSLRAPEVIVLQEYNGQHHRTVSFSRRNVYARDGHTCQYCGKKFGSEKLTLDHVIPRCLGGKSTWRNIVLACYRCNNQKGGRTPKQANMKLLRKPKQPHWEELQVQTGQGAMPTSWESFLNELYWNQELQK